MNVAVVTSLFPSCERPREGIFAERRWQAFSERGHGVRIIQPIPWSPPGMPGARAEYRRMARKTERNGLAVQRPVYPHLPGGLGAWASILNARQFARVARRAVLHERPDVVVLDYAWPAAELVTGIDLPCVVSGRGSDVLAVAEDAALAPRLARALRHAAGYFAVSEHLAQAMDELSGLAGTGILIANGVDMGRFTPGPRGPARAELGLPGEGPLVGVVGHLIPRKDPLLALECFLRAAPPDARLVFVGRGELEPALRRSIAAAGAEERVSLLGEFPPQRLANLYRALDVLLLTSSREGRPNVVLEAFASGTPVVATPAGGTPELFEGVDLGLARDRSFEALSDALSAVLDRPPPAEQLKGAVAPRTWDACASQIEQLLNSLLDRAAANRESSRDN